MPYSLQEIHGVTPQDLSKINENMQNLWFKVFGDIQFSDGNDDLKAKISTQEIPFQGEGNFDKNYPYYCRFYVPSDIKKINKVNFNIILERYRMDSDVASGGGTSVNINTNSSTAQQNVSASVASQTVQIGVASSSAYASASAGGYSYSETYPVEAWGATSNIPQPGQYLDPSRPLAMAGSGYLYDSGSGKGITLYQGDNTYKDVVDLYKLQHVHRIILNTSHSHSISVSPHSHDVNISPHSHSITIQPHSHTVLLSFTIPEHTHQLNEGIKVSGTTPQGVDIYINDNKILTLNGEQTQNEIDITSYVTKGSWNVIKCTTTGVARAIIYGIMNLVKNYFN